VRDGHEKDAAQGVVGNVPQDVPQDLAQDLAFGARVDARPPRQATTAAAAVFVQLALRWGATGQLSGIWLGLWGSAPGSNQVKIYSPHDTQAKYTEQSATNVPLWSTGTQGAPCRKQQAEWELMDVSRERCSKSRGCVG